MMQHKNTLKVLRFSDLVQLGIVNNRMTLRRWVKKGAFPAPFRISPKRLAWRAPEVEKFLEERQLERVTYTKDSPPESA